MCKVRVIRRSAFGVLQNTPALIITHQTYSCLSRHVFFTRVLAVRLSNFTFTFKQLTAKVVRIFLRNIFFGMLNLEDMQSTIEER